MKSMKSVNKNTENTGEKEVFVASYKDKLLQTESGCVFSCKTLKDFYIG